MEGRSEGTAAKTTEGRNLKPLRSTKEQRAQREREWYSTRGGLEEPGDDAGLEEGERWTRWKQAAHTRL